MVVSDASDQWLPRRVDRKQVKPDEIEALQRAPAVSTTQFFDMLREELLGQQFSGCSPSAWRP